VVIFRGSDRAQLNLNYVLIIPIANNQRRRRPAMQEQECEVAQESAGKSH
jgi:hypothetical protein